MNKVEYKNILIVEDDDGLRNSLAAHFSVANRVCACSDLKTATSALKEKRFDIVLLDLILPDGSGLKLMEVTGSSPVIILSDLGADDNILDGFSAGAVDYIVKPSSFEIIEARMALRLLPDHRANVSAQGLTVSLSKRTAVYNGVPLELTSSEFNILSFLMQNEGKFFTAAEIYDKVWKMPNLNTTTVKAHLSNLRKKMLAASKGCADLIITEFGKGYAFSGGGND